MGKTEKSSHKHKRSEPFSPQIAAFLNSQLALVFIIDAILGMGDTYKEVADCFLTLNLLRMNFEKGPARFKMSAI